MNKKISILLLLSLFSITLSAQITPDSSGRWLVSKHDGQPFFWLGDTGWELFHRLDRDEAVHYLETRSRQGFNVIMSVALAELDGIRKPNRYGDVPFNNLKTLEWDTTTGNDPNDSAQYDYWDHVDFVIREAAKRNMYIGLLPAWGDKVVPGAAGPVIFTNEERAYHYAKKLAERYKDQWNILWILGGDRQSVEHKNNRITADYRPVWRAMARAFEETSGKDTFIAYHPRGGSSTSRNLQQEEWLDMHAIQSSHGSREVKVWNQIADDLKLIPRRPVMDMEPCYEDHPVNPWDGRWTRSERGYFDDYDVRTRIYRAVFAGGCGTVYGHHQVWQFVDTTRNAPIWVGDTIIGWQKALEAKAANHIHHLKELMLSHPDFHRMEDNSLIASERGSDYTDEIIATRNLKGSYAMIYLPRPEPVTINMNKLKEGRRRVYWFNPVSGKKKKVRGRTNADRETFTPPSQSQKDWVLLIDVK
ncbi:MAG: glycoside hydrolase family 140 protein [Proteiniphilum sp.]|nr:glycoside hydrolase family 140 protein [Proteiniphilum sp.]